MPFLEAIRVFINNSNTVVMNNREYHTFGIEVDGPALASAATVSSIEEHVLSILSNGE